MVSNNMSGIEKLKELAYQIQREHVSELQTIEERYKIDLQNAREARDIAIKEAAEYKHQLGNIIEYLGSCSRKKPVLSSQNRYERIMSELDKRLMPPDMEWPRFEDGEKVAFGVRVYGLDDVCEKYIFTRSQGGVCQLQDANGCMVNVLSRERAKRHEPEVIGADGLPIKVGDTVYDGTGNRHVVVEVDTDRALVEFDGEPKSGWRASFITHTQPDTQKRIYDDVYKISDACTYFSSDGSCVKCKFVSQYGDADSAYEACPKSVELEQLAILDLLRRQRELDARTIGGE